MSIAPDGRHAGKGVVGARELVTVQTFDIARLTTHAVPVVPGTFIAVSGVGPKGDSNGSGKTSFLAAITVLLADPQWRLDINGGQLAAGLLFKPEAAGVEGAQFAPAPHGYIVGLFVDPEDPTGIESPPLTVWVRMSTQTPYLQVRWENAILVADDDTDELRYNQADSIWKSLSANNQCSARKMQESLYGDAPRCMAYLDTTLRRAAVSLLSQQMTEMSPDAIGQSLIELAGLRHLLEEEQSQRNALAEHQRRLSDAGASHEKRLREEDAELAGVANRQQARDRLAYGAEMWRLHFAKRYVEIVPEQQSATTTIAEATATVASARADLEDARDAHRLLAERRDLTDAELEARTVWDKAKEARERADQERAIHAHRITETAARRPSLVAASEGWNGTSVEDAAAALETALSDAAEAELRRRNAERASDEAGETLRQAEAGISPDTAEVVAALDVETISATVLADTVTIDESARDRWEPVLWPWRSAVVVAPTDAELAIAAVRDLPGAVLVAADADDAARPLPDGITSGVPVGGLLAALGGRTEYHPDPHRVADRDAGVVVVGGFPDPTTGREARIAAARAGVDAAAGELRDAKRALARANLEVRAASATADQARAVADLEQLDAELKRLTALVAGYDQRIPGLRDAEQNAFSDWQEADVLVRTHDLQVTAAGNVVKQAKRSLSDAEDARKKALKALDDLHLSYWRDGWGDTVDAAHALLNEQEDQVKRLTSKRLRNRAQEALKDALDAYEADVGEVPSDIEEVRERRDDLADGDDPTPRAVSFQDLSRPLRTRLLGSTERDAITNTKIRRDRAEREAMVGDLDREVSDRTGTLQTLQDMIERSLEGHFGRMSAALDRLDCARGGHGAELLVHSRRPESPTSPWRWEVSPRWRRSPGGKMITYREVANGAQVKVYAVQVTLSALLAAEDTTGRVLVIDELGNSLGEVNRKDVLGALRRVAEEQRVTILGTCQDSVLYDASEQCKEILWFTHAALTDAYNQPVRIWAYDAEQRRVELTSDWLRSGRPLA